MKRRTLIKGMAATLPSLWLSRALGNNFLDEQHSIEPIATGPFQPTWESLENFKTPEWYRNAKFGMWAHWGPQCQPESRDWYARGMYQEGSWQYKINYIRIIFVDEIYCPIVKLFDVRFTRRVSTITPIPLLAD